MLPKVDTGAIIAERRVAIAPDDSVMSLQERTLGEMLDLFREMLEPIAAGRPLPAATISWGRRPFTRKELNALTRLDRRMPPEEIARRVRATTYPGFPAASFQD